MQIRYGSPSSPRSTRSAARSATRPPFPPEHPPGTLPPAWLHLLAARCNPRRLGRTNPRQAKRSHHYPRKPADPSQRPPQRGPLTLVLLPLQRLLQVKGIAAGGGQDWADPMATTGQNS